MSKLAKFKSHIVRNSEDIVPKSQENLQMFVWGWACKHTQYGRQPNPYGESCSQRFGADTAHKHQPGHAKLYKKKTI